jgi:hypothetical protein
MVLRNKEMASSGLKLITFINSKGWEQIMGFLNKFFFNSAKKRAVSIAPTTFLECVSIAQNWSAKIAVDPDFDSNDPDLRAALETLVTCPYCSTNFIFGSAVTFQGARAHVQCPACRTIPRKEKNFEYGGA